MKKICVVTGTRAEYGLLYWLMKEIEASSKLELQIVVTGMHMSPDFGLTYKVIEADGFKINEKFEILCGDSNVDIAKATAKATAQFAEAFVRLEPDLIVVLGDRYELLAATQTALFMQLPVAHISGGDTTEGAFDEAIRHSITKMSHLHFVTNAVAEIRVKQLGENPQHIYNVGNSGLDHLTKTKLLSREDLQKVLGLNFKEHIYLVTFHPVTLEYASGINQLSELFAALTLILASGDCSIVITKSNSDTGGLTLNKMIEEFAAVNNNVAVFTSLGTLRYLSLMSISRAVIGNSSSGLLEAPSLKIPTINIGDRQRGRLAAASVFHCKLESRAISEAVQRALLFDCSKVVNPYGKGDSSKKIFEIIESYTEFKSLIKKHFFDLEVKS